MIWEGLLFALLFRFPDDPGHPDPAPGQNQIMIGAAVKPFPLRTLDREAFAAGALRRRRVPVFRQDAADQALFPSFLTEGLAIRAGVM